VSNQVSIENGIELAGIPVDLAPTYLSGVDELFAAVNTEFSCLNLLAFQYPGTTLTLAREKMMSWQVGNENTFKIPQSEQRKNGERLEKYGLLNRSALRNGRDGYTFTYTERGIVGCALAGYNLGLADEHGINLSKFYGPKVRRITGKIDDESTIFSSPLFRSLLFLATRKFADTNGEVRAQSYPKLPGIEEVTMVDEIKVRHVEDLHEQGFLSVTKRTEFANGKPFRTNCFSVPPDKQAFADDLQDIIKGISVIDESWTDFILGGLAKAKAITSNPRRVSALLSNRDGQMQTTYELSEATMLEKTMQLRESRPFTTGELRKFLGGNHDLQYLSNYLSRLVKEGLLTASLIDGSNRRLFS